MHLPTNHYGDTISVMRFVVGEFYHVYNRGVEGRNIFLEDADYRRFLKALLAFNADQSIELRFQQNTEIVSPKERLASLTSYALMPNHVHLLFHCINEKNLSLFLQKIFIGYTMYFNAKYERKGVLFQGRSKSKHISDDRYLKHLFDYIHLNPLDSIMPEWRTHGIANVSAAKTALMEYKWSSLHGILNQKQDSILDYGLISELFPDRQDLLKSMLEWSSEKLENSEHFILD